MTTEAITEKTALQELVEALPDMRVDDPALVEVFAGEALTCQHKIISDSAEDADGKGRIEAERKMADMFQVMYALCSTDSVQSDGLLFSWEAFASNYEKGEFESWSDLEFDDPSREAIPRLVELAQSLEENAQQIRERQNVMWQELLTQIPEVTRRERWKLYLVFQRAVTQETQQVLNDRRADHEMNVPQRVFDLTSTYRAMLALVQRSGLPYENILQRHFEGAATMAMGSGSQPFADLRYLDGDDMSSQVQAGAEHLKKEASGINTMSFTQEFRATYVANPEEFERMLLGMTSEEK